MPSGPHAGSCGSVFYVYKVSDNSVSELAFIPTDRYYEVWERDTGRLTFMSDENTFYMLSGNNVYKIDAKKHKSEAVFEDIDIDSYSISDSKGILILTERDAAGRSLGFTATKLDTGETADVYGEAGERIEFLGFYYGDSVYGKGSKSYEEGGEEKLIYDGL